MPEINKHEIRSPEMQEVMSEIPGRFLRWGLLLFFTIILAILAVSWFISYPDIVTAPVTLTTYNSPASLIAKSGGTISGLFVKNEDRVMVNQPVALIGNQAEWEDVKSLAAFLDSIGNPEEWQGIVNNLTPLQSLKLGEIQSSYLKFSTLLRQFSDHINKAYIPSKLEILQKQIKRQEEYIAEQINLLKLSEEDFRLSLKSYSRDSGLFVKDNNSISLNQIEKSKQALLQKQVSFISLRSSVKNNESSLLKLKESRLDLGNQLEGETARYNTDLSESLQLLKVSIGQWQDKYLITSPVKGKITFTTFWNVTQVIRSGELFATVIPDNPSRIIVRAIVPPSGLGRIRPGQEVNIKLSGFPYMEFGIVKGKIRTISMVPADDGYVAEIDPVNGMRSSYGINIDFISEMTGTVDIVTDNKRLIYRFVKPLNRIMKKQ
jgi:multidrug efflux pump subunit AcrA (membrane-fusion protein)